MKDFLHRLAADILMRKTRHKTGLFVFELLGYEIEIHVLPKELREDCNAVVEEAEQGSVRKADAMWSDLHRKWGPEQEVLDCAKIIRWQNFKPGRKSDKKAKRKGA
jgi:hypothetical protein